MQVCPHLASLGGSMFFSHMRYKIIYDLFPSQKAVKYLLRYRDYNAVGSGD